MERISQLKLGSPGTAIDVRILRKWIPFFRASETWFIVVDKHADVIQILAEKPDQAYVESKLIVSHCYRLHDYSCSKTNEYQKVLNTQVHMNVGPASSIVEIDNTDMIPKFWFQFQTADYLDSIKDKNEELPDLIGVFKKLRDCKKKDLEPYVNISLVDINNQEMNVNLWRECINVPEKFDRSKLDNCSSDIIIAITTVKVTSYGDALRISSTAATHVYVNPAIPETATLLHSLQSGTSPLSNRLAPHTFITLEDLNTRQRSDIFGKTFVCKAHISTYSYKNSWYTVMCRACPKQIWKKGNSWFCTTDGTVQSPKFLYNLSAKIIDETSNMSVLLPDETATKLAGKPCEEVVQKEGFEDMTTLPPTLERCKKNQYSFHLQLARRSPADRLLFAIVDIRSISAQQTTTITPVPSTPSTESPQSSSANIFSPMSSQKTHTSRRLIYDSPDNMTPLTPTKRQRFPD